MLKVYHDVTKCKENAYDHVKWLFKFQQYPIFPRLQQDSRDGFIYLWLNKIIFHESILNITEIIRIVRWSPSRNNIP